MEAVTAMDRTTRGGASDAAGVVRARGALAAFVCVFVIVACTGTTKQAGGIEILLETDMPTPATFDAVDLKLEQQAAGGTWRSILDRDYVIPAEMSLPTTFALEAGSSPYQTVRITVTGLAGNPKAPVVRRIVETQVPTDRVGEVVVALSSTCLGKVSCPITGDSCQPDSGVCAPTTVTAARPYNPRDLTDAGVASTTHPAPEAGPPAMTMGMTGDDATVDDGGTAPDDAPSGVADADAGCAESSLNCNGQQPQVCTAGQFQDMGAACSNSACVAGTCQGVCSPQGLRCTGNGVETCDATGAWGAAAACPAATPICNGAGVCGACANGSTQCASGGVQTCVSGAWLAAVPCSGQACSMGVCTGTCAPNTTQCSGNGVQTCDATGHWSATVTSCGAQACVSGKCQGVCSPGSSQCSGGVETCSAAGAWGTPQACGAHQTCTGGGAAGTAACTCAADPACKASGATCANGTTLDACSQDAQGCFFASTSSPCTNGACFGAAGSAQCCTNACTNAAKRCGGLGVETCQVQGNGCTAWNAGQACPGAHQSCTGSGTCACNTDANCSTASNVCQSSTLVTCAADAQGCFYTVSSAACGTNKTCQNGGCICQAAFTACGASCFNVTNDPGHCGSCTNACPTLSSPNSGNCTGDTCFGYAGGAVTTSGSVTIDNLNTVYAVRAITPGAAGTFVGINAVVSSTAAAGTTSSVIVALYSDGGGGPGTLLFDNGSNPATFANPSSLFTFQIFTSGGTLDNGFTGALAANTTYWVYIKEGNNDPQAINVGLSTSPCQTLQGWINYGPPTFAWPGNQFYPVGSCPGNLALSLEETFP
jgi:hypothetical protein